jgi:four helix bundle protein
MQSCFDHEKLDVYKTSLTFICWLTPVLEEIRQLKGPITANIRDQLDRASISLTLNIAEGNGKWSTRSRGSFFEIARVSD